jgi:ubiquitin-protein ligase
MMLSNPVLEQPVNTEAARICESAPGAYRQMILDNVLASKRVDGRYTSKRVGW